MSFFDPIRRAQLISPFGPGAMFVTKDGVSVMIASIDYWFRREDGTADANDIDPMAYRVIEWRLQAALDVDYFLLPPDHRERKAQTERVNIGLTIPTVRFPTWHWCSNCHNLYSFSLYETKNRIFCENCLQPKEDKKGRKRLLVQVPFIAVCPAGHIQDFPFGEWVHKSVNPQCTGQLKLQATGGATLSAQKVSCSCGLERPLTNIQGVAGKDDKDTVLSSQLDRSTRYVCKASSPWKGELRCGSCDDPLRGGLRSASNIYFAKVKSSIYLPAETANIPPELLALFDAHPVGTVLNLFKAAGGTGLLGVLRMQESSKALLEQYSDVQIQAAIDVKVHGSGAKGTAKPHRDDDEETAFRRVEYGVLTSAQELPDLVVRPNPLQAYDPTVGQYFSMIHSVERLRETRALYGFTRILSENGSSLADKKTLLSKRTQTPGDRWLPAYIVYGEGLFLVFDDSKIKEWLKRVSNVLPRRIKNLDAHYTKMKSARGIHATSLGPRFLLAHTFAHILINRLTFECGYNSASLRERLFISDAPGAEMSGVLIYTAAGDSEGTMGGLVRMARPGYFEKCVSHALDAAQWCSNDPICMEAGRSGGQGPDSCNLAACHSCCLLPETACEESNRFLDRAVLVGDVDSPELAFFKT